MQRFAYGLAGVTLALLTVLGVSSSFGNQTPYSGTAAANFAAACSFEATHGQTVSISSSSAATTNATGIGVVRIMCTQDAHMYQGAVGVTGPTAGTGDLFLPGYSPEYFVSKGSKFAFIRDSADGTCYVSECQ